MAVIVRPGAFCGPKDLCNCLKVAQVLRIAHRDDKKQIRVAGQTGGNPEREDYTSFHNVSRGSSGFSLASSRYRSLLRSSRGSGTVTVISTISSPRTPSLVAEGRT